MFDLALQLAAAGLSLYFWGLIRTAIWLGISLLAGDLSACVPAALLSFWAVIATVAPYQAGAFDLRDFSKQKWALVFFFTGLATGALTYPQLLFFGAGAAVPWIVLQVFRLFNFPATQVLFLPKNLRLWIIGLWVLAVALRWMEPLWLQ